jgi:hypothetical protein
MQYSVTIFELAGLSNAAQVNASVLIAATQVVFTLISAASSDRFLRKTLLLGTMAVMGAAHGGLGVFFKMQRENERPWGAFLFCFVCLTLWNFDMCGF